MTIYFLEGNIGSGKSTFLKIISSEIESKNIKNVEVIYEPVDIWQGMGLLEKFYQDRERWGYTFQNIAFITKMMEIDKLDSKKTYIIERSPYTDMNCFAKLCYEDGCMSEMEWNAYNLWFNHYVDKINHEIKFIDLKTAPNVCMERMRARDRNEEVAVPIEYLESLDKKHHEWLSNKSDDVIHLDGNGNKCCFEKYAKDLVSLFSQEYPRPNQ